MMRFLFRAIAALLVASGAAGAFELPAACTQCLVGTTDGWNSSTVRLTLFRKKDGHWQREGDSWDGRTGKNGLVWGLGLHPVPKGAAVKREGDFRAPAGVFGLGGVWGYAREIARNPALPYQKITSRDLWVEDPASRDYNRHLHLDHEPATPWEKKQQMKQSDPAHALKFFILHNAPPKVVPGAGSSIFFHIWRGGGSKPTAGCTTMAETRLRKLIAAIDPAARPLYVLLPKAEYDRLRGPWKLP